MRFDAKRLLKTHLSTRPKIKSMKVLIGHRGVGKTSFLKEVLLKNPTLQGFDLDEEIEKEISIDELFQKKEGVGTFRKKEEETFKELCLKKPDIISVGAGFNLNLLEDSCFCIWLRRESDKEGRIFFDRPRLKQNLNELEESKQIFSEREHLYEKKAHQIITLQENFKGSEASLDDFPGDLDLSHISLTLLPNQNMSYLLTKNFKFFEIRTDFFSTQTQKELEELINRIPEEKRLFSFRSLDHFDFFASQIGTKDWALELGEVSRFQPEILSLHETSSLEEAFQKLEASRTSSKQHLKLAPLVSNFEDLKKGHLWGQDSSETRSFLPVSHDGRWAWYRIFMQKKIKLNFFRQGTSSFLDQPFFYEISSRKFKKIGAVIGAPITYSQTPSFQKKFFHEHDLSSLAIHVEESELTNALMDFFKSLGVKALAVTSPLKKKVFHLINPKKEGSYNTLFFHEDGVRATNTDSEGFRWIASVLNKEEDVVLWGGGGIIESLKQEIPRASMYSSRTGEAKEGSCEIKSPEALIWAVPPKKTFHSLPSKWKPQFIFDLNYQESSYARSYAKKINAKYFSGEEFFKAQGLKQRKFWKLFF